MKRMLRNVSHATIRTNYHGRIYTIGSKATLVLDSIQDEDAADYLLQTYAFLRDDTPRNIPVPETKTIPVMNAKGKIVQKKVFVPRKAIPKGGN